jgi:hypothetical protein
MPDLPHAAGHAEKKTMQDYEKLGAFYLARSYDLEQGARRAELIRYDTKDLTTHAMIIGMTGSGIHPVGLGWRPHVHDIQGRLVPAWR